jgi:photosystem II stability/assembly factor-like uncharacterized protein
MNSKTTLIHTFALLLLPFTLLAAAPPAAEKHPGMPSGPELQPAPSIQALAVAKDRSVYAGSFGMGVFRSETQGKSWAPASTGLRDRFILCLAAADDGTVYAGTLHGGVFRTKDGGRSWQAINNGLTRGQVKTLLVAQGALYAGTGGGVYRLVEGEAAWTIVTKGLDETVVHALVLTDDRTLYAGTAAKGVQRFKASGSEWSRMPARGLKDHEGLVENFIRVLVADKDRTLYAGTFDGGVFRSGDGGETWRPISRALPNDSIRGIVTGPGGLLVATGRGIFKSLDEGRQWMPLNAGLTELSIQALMPAGGGVLYAGTSAGAFRSDDEGRHWVNISEGLAAPPAAMQK